MNSVRVLKECYIMGRSHDGHGMHAADTGLWRSQARICDVRGEKFYPSIKDQTTCTQCMILPSPDEENEKLPFVPTAKTIAKAIDLKYHTNMEARMMTLTKKKGICTYPGCGKEFTRRGNCHKRCPEHEGKPLPKSAQEPATTTARKNIASALIRKSPVATIVADEIQAEQVINMLIAGGFVTQQKIDQARAFLKNIS